MFPNQLQTELLVRLTDAFSFRGVFDHFPGVFFFVKDRDSRLVAASTSVFPRLGVSSEAEMVGRPDADFFPPEIAEGYRNDDTLVLRTGEPMVDRQEICYDEKRKPDWGVTTKVPLRDQWGTIIGLMGITRHHARRGARKAALPGGTFFSLQAPPPLIDLCVRPPASSHTGNLTRREIEIMQMLATGAVCREVAAQLSITLETVRDHLKRIYGKLHVHSRMDAVRKYLGEA